MKEKTSKVIKVFLLKTQNHVEKAGRAYPKVEPRKIDAQLAWVRKIKLSMCCIDKVARARRRFFKKGFSFDFFEIKLSVKVLKLKNIDLAEMIKRN